MKTSDFNYELPQELIAQTPLERRDGSRLMTLDRNTGAWEHHHFYELPDFLRSGDCLILNNSRVLPARLLGQRMPGGGACEILLLIDRGDKTWECLVRPGRHLREGVRLSFGNGELTAEVTKVLPDGNRLVRFDYEGIFLEVLEHLGKMPLPPYHQGGASGSEAVSDCVFQGAWQRSGPHGGTAFYTGAVGKNRGAGRWHRLCDASCRIGDVPSGKGG